MLSELCGELRNYFLAHRESDKYQGEYTIEDGSIDLDDILVEGQYFRIVGSTFNDGVYQYPATNLKDETFNGAIWAMAIPPEVIALAAEIDTWKQNNASTLNSPYQSESFGGYSYSKGTGKDGGAYTWKDQFAARLNRWRKIHE